MPGPNGPSTGHAEYVPRRHRGEDRSVQPPQSRIISQAADDVVDQAAILAELAKPEAQQPAEPPPDTLPTRAEAVHAQAISTVDLLTSHTIQRLDELIREIEDLKSTLLADNARVKGYFTHHLELANTAVKQTNELTAVFRDLREERARVINAVVSQ
jgi:hypothetical protein